MLKTPAIDRVLNSLKSIRKKYSNEASVGTEDNALSCEKQNEAFLDMDALDSGVSSFNHPMIAVQNHWLLHNPTNYENKAQIMLCEKPESVCGANQASNSGPGVFNGIAARARALADAEMSLSQSNVG